MEPFSSNGESVIAVPMPQKSQMNVKSTVIMVVVLMLVLGQLVLSISGPLSVSLILYHKTVTQDKITTLHVND